MFYKNQGRILRVSVVVILLAAAESVAAQSAGAFAANQSPPVAVKKNVRPYENPDERKLDEESVEIYKRELLSSPDDAILYNNLGAAHVRLQNYDKAITALEKAIALKPDFANAYFNLSIVYDFQKRYANALAAIQKAAELDDTNSNIRTEMCLLYLLTEDFQNAASCYETLFKMTSPGSKIRIGYAVALLRLEQNDKALSVARENVQLFPRDPQAHNSLGIILFLRKKYKQAVESFTRAVELNPDFDEARYNLAVTQMTANDRDSALKQYNLLKKSNSEYAGMLYKFLYGGKIVYANK